MRILLVLIAVAASLAACGGGGAGGSASSGGNSTGGLSVALASTSGSASATEGSATSFSATATVSGTVPAGAIADIQYDNTVLASGTATAGSGAYTINAQTKADLAPGTYTGTITFRLCKETACTNVYAGSTATYAYTLDVKLQDWQTYQRDAAHTGFVNMSYDPTKFSQAWTWTAGGYLFPMATGNGLVYVSSNEAANGGYDAKVYAVKASDGTVAWSYDIPNAQAISQPASSSDAVTVTTSTNSGSSFAWSLDPLTGTLKAKTAIALTGDYALLQLAPTPFDDKTYIHAGTSLGQTYSLTRGNGAIGWTAGDTTAMTKGQTPAVSAGSVYIYDGAGLQVMDRTTGSVSFRIADPNGVASYQFGGAPIISGSNSVLAYSGISLSGSFDMDGPPGPFVGRKLLHYNLTTKAIDWTSSAYLSGVPALGNSVIYAGDSATQKLMAIRESDGTILWSVTAPDAVPGFQWALHGNVVVTKNLVFFSTDSHIYAVDISTHAVVWTYNSPGLLAISPENILYIATGSLDYINNSLISNRKLVAIKLK